jgi:hypothetical protein
VTNALQHPLHVIVTRHKYHFGNFAPHGAVISMARLEEMTRGASVKGVLPDGLVTVVDVQWHGSDVVELIYKDAAGKLGSELLYRDREPTLGIAAAGVPWSFDGDGALFRLVSEAHRIRLAHLFDRGVLHIRENVYQGHFGSPKTQSSIGDLPLGPQVVNALLRHRNKQGSDLHPGALVFPNEKGGPHDTHNLLWRVLYPACKTAEVPRVSWHGLRHTHATLLNSQGESMKTIQAQLRHSSARVTMEIYTHAIPQHQRDAVERLEQVIGPKWTQIQESDYEDASLIH